MGHFIRHGFLSHKDLTKLLSTHVIPARSKLRHLAQPVYKHDNSLGLRQVYDISTVTHCHLDSGSGNICKTPAGFSLLFTMVSCHLKQGAMVTSNEKPAGVLQPLPVPESRWHWVTVNLLRMCLRPRLVTQRLSCLWTG